MGIQEKTQRVSFQLDKQQQQTNTQQKRERNKKLEEHFVRCVNQMHKYTVSKLTTPHGSCVSLRVFNL